VRVAPAHLSPPPSNAASLAAGRAGERESRTARRVLVRVTPDEAIDAVEAIHADVDRLAAPLVETHAGRLACARGCIGCCVDELTVFEVEAEAIRARFGDVLASAEPHPPGRCAFLGAAGECRVYAARPYVCRTQGLPLRWIDDEAMAEYRDICELNEEGAPVETLAEDDCWTIGPIEERLARLQAGIDGGELRRVTLRSLFPQSSRPES
jgi:Fe-S-cluster containining protein